MEEEYENEKEENESWGAAGIITIVVLAVLAIWALVHFNPSEEEHEEKIAEIVAEAKLEGAGKGYSVSLPGISTMEYHSIGICSWTTMKQFGGSHVTSIGILGYVHPLIK